MRRSGITEKGVQAERWRLHLGFINGLRDDELGRFAKQELKSDLVAEPMARHGHRCSSCRTIWWIVCRHILVAVCLMAGCVMVLDHAFLEPTAGIRNVTLDEPNPVETTTDSAEPLTTTLQVVEIEEQDTFRAVFSVDFTGATQRVVNVSLTTGEATLRKTNNATVDLQREWLAHRVLQHVQLALEQYNRHDVTLVGNGEQYGSLTSDVGSDNRRLQVVDMPYRQAMQADSLDAAARPNVLQRLGSQVLHFVSQNNDDQQHRTDKRKHAGILVTVLLSTALLISSIVCGMQQHGFRQHQGHQQGPRSNVHQSDAGPPFVGTATLKVPPSWSVERNHVYSLRSWISDLVLWSSATEIDPARQGPITALQVQGSAKELVRELTPMQLRDGDVDQMTGQHVTGLTLLVTVLARRYAPLEAENCTRSISEFLQFRRAPNESIDNVLVRYDILRHRAQQRAGFAINVTGLSWLLLQSLQLSSESWDRLLSPLGGNMPNNEQEFGELTERVRRLFHLKEGRFAGASHQQGAMGDPGAYFADGGYFPTFTEHHDISTPTHGNEANGMPPAGSVYAAGGPNPPDPWANASQVPFMSGAGSGWNTSGGGENWNASASYHAANDGTCPTCGIYFNQDDESTGTSSDDGSTIADNVDGSEVYQDYLYAKRRWRKYAGKPPRRYRRFGKGFGKKGSYNTSSAGFIPPNAFAGGKGKGGSKGGSSQRRKNPRDKNGELMKCHVCGPQSQRSLALMTARPNTWSMNNVLPGVQFFTSGNFGVGSSVSAEIDNLRSVSQASSVVSGGSDRRARTALGSPRPSSSGVNPDQPPTWSPGNKPVDGEEDDEVTPLVSGAAAPSFPPPPQSPDVRSLVSNSGRKRDRDGDEAARQANADGLRSVLLGISRPDRSVGQNEPSAARPRSSMFPWWEVDDPPLTPLIYHLRTRRRNGSVGLLIDPGAHDNLTGDQTADQMCDEVGCKMNKKPMNQHLPVEGVGRNSQTAFESTKVEMCLVDIEGNSSEATYTAPMIMDSSLPPLLGNKTLRKTKAIIDCGDGKMILPGPGGVEVKLSPGSRVYDLELTDSGHYVLPIWPRSDEKVKKGNDEGRLDFAMDCRVRKSSPVRSSTAKKSS